MTLNHQRMKATVLDNITDFVSGLFGKDKQEGLRTKQAIS